MHKNGAADIYIRNIFVYFILFSFKENNRGGALNW